LKAGDDVLADSKVELLDWDDNDEDLVLEVVKSPVAKVVGLGAAPKPSS
jgi:hypothetical protein